MTTRHHPIEAEELMAYLDGELAPDQAAIAAAHLETCMECQQIATDLMVDVSFADVDSARV